eukprot:gene12132-biopygen13994
MAKKIFRRASRAGFPMRVSAAEGDARICPERRALSPRLRRRRERRERGEAGSGAQRGGGLVRGRPGTLFVSDPAPPDPRVPESPRIPRDPRERGFAGGGRVAVRGAPGLFQHFVLKHTRRGAPAPRPHQCPVTPALCLERSEVGPLRRGRHATDGGKTSARQDHTPGDSGGSSGRGGGRGSSGLHTVRGG